MCFARRRESEILDDGGALRCSLQLVMVASIISPACNVSTEGSMKLTDSPKAHAPNVLLTFQFRLTELHLSFY